MATTRLRRTFRYPADSDSDDPPDLDEEHQETLLKDLQTQDEASSNLYRHFFLALPILTSLSYITSLFTSSNATSLFLVLLEIAVPALAALVLWIYPVGLAERGGQDSIFGGQRRALEGLKAWEREVVTAGGVLAGLLVLMFGISSWKGEGEEGLWVGLPGGMFGFLFSLFNIMRRTVELIMLTIILTVVYFLTLFVRQQLAPVDLEELRKARYELKGA